MPAALGPPGTVVDEQRDVVVVGAGHNGLVAACYLARSGLDVEVVERDVVAGGAVSTVERFPGHQVDRGSSAHILIRHTGIVEDLGLADCGLRYQDLDPWGYVPLADGGITFRVDLEETCASIARACGPADADGYRRFVRDWQPRAAALLTAFQRPPRAGPLGRALWQAWRSSGLPPTELTRQALAPADAVLDGYFGDERLRAALAWLAAQSGPPADRVGTAPQLGWLTLLHQRPPGHPVGGSGRLADALVERLMRSGGRLQLGDPAVGIDTAGDRVVGVSTGSGRRLMARAVLAGCHIGTTLELLGTPAARTAAARVPVSDGLGAVVRLETDALPQYPDAPTDVHRSMQLLVRSRHQLRAAYGDHLAGRPPTDPPALVMTFSAFDDTLAPPGRHGVTVWAQWYPYRLADGRAWPQLRAAAGDRLVATVNQAAPGFADSVRRVHVQTPLDLEQELGLRQGDVMHLRMTPDAMFGWRPLPGWGGYRTPVPGLYLTGASTHPGGGVFGASGRAAAAVLLADLSRGWRARGRAGRAAGRSPGSRSSG